MKSLGNEVEYFGMADERNCVGNRVEAYTENIEFSQKIVKAYYLSLLKLFIRLSKKTNPQGVKRF